MDTQDWLTLGIGTGAVYLLTQKEPEPPPTERCDLTVNISGTGKVTVSHGDKESTLEGPGSRELTVEKGKKIKIETIPGTGFVLSNTFPTNFKIIKDMTIKVVFEPIKVHPLTVGIQGKGTVKTFVNNKLKKLFMGVDENGKH